MKHTFKGGKYWGIPQKKLDHLVLIIYIPSTSDFLCRLPLPGHSYILSPFHPYIAFMPVQFLCAITVYKVHYCIIVILIILWKVWELFNDLACFIIIIMLGHYKKLVN